MAEKKKKCLNEPVTLEAQERLIEIMNNSPRLASFKGTDWEVTALKPGTQWLIAQEAVSIEKADTATYGDVIKQFALNIPSVVKVITLGLLNDRSRIFANGRDGAFSEEYNATYQTIMWETNQSFWLILMNEMLKMLDVEVFFSNIALIQMTRQSLLERKTTMEERRQLSPEQNGGK